MKLITTKEHDSYSDVDGGNITIKTWYFLSVPFWFESIL